MLGSQVGNYTITEELAQGGMGEVYVARHGLMQRDAVVKVLRPELSVNREMVQRFFNEARAATSIHHPGIVEVFDMGYADDGRAFIVMEQLRGEALSKRLAHAPVSAARAVSYTRQLVGALGAAHERGIVHRDLKPDNLFVVPDPEVPGGERIKVLDFGIAKLAVDKGGSLVTEAGAVFGTPAYMAPEQCTSTATVDLRADLYAVGCIFYELLCGRPPFGHGGVELFAAHLRDDPPPPRSIAPAVPAELEAVVLRLLAKRPEERFQSCAELVGALDACPPLEAVASQPPAVAPTYAAAATSPQPGATDLQAPPPLASPTEVGHAATLPSVDARPAVAVGSELPIGSSRPPEVQPATTRTVASGQTVARPEGVRKGLLVGIGIAVLLGAAGGVFALRALGRDNGESATRPDDERRRGRRAARDESRVDRLLGEGLQALAEEEWATAVGKATQALAIDPDNAAAEDLQARAEGEIENRATFRKIESAADESRAEDVARFYDELPEVSAYRARARPLYERARDEWLAPRLEKSAAYAKKRRCTKIPPIAEEVARVFPDASPEIEQLAAKCRPRTSSGKGTAKRPPKTAKQRLAEARAALKAGNAGTALRLCEKVLSEKPGDVDAAVTCAIAACTLRNVAKAKRYTAQLKGEWKRMAERMCRRAGVRLLERKRKPGRKAAD